ncbi:uncharacterized protein N7487_002200 [Penicillium crustosum]|uniref:uncharacterized protein n=1 Tax=Penicillium crustosum TaxID=36656 RepID=UPI002390B0B5|nr:uncharacterized protein N7487_002200 [Penicillium crustosum]KAJ5418650.1 hypothetical protein N7487_002200 [Penicillium crustosum]
MPPAQAKKRLNTPSAPAISYGQPISTPMIASDDSTAGARAERVENWLGGFNVAVEAKIEDCQ